MKYFSPILSKLSTHTHSQVSDRTHRMRLHANPSISQLIYWFLFQYFVHRLRCVGIHREAENLASDHEGAANEQSKPIFDTFGVWCFAQNPIPLRSRTEGIGQ